MILKTLEIFAIVIIITLGLFIFLVMVKSMINALRKK